MRDLIAKIYRPNSVEHSGTAWLASENHALTCFHCIDDANGQPFPADMHYQLKFESGIEVKAILVAHDANVDVALLKILDHGFPTKGKILFGKLPRGEDWSRYRAYQKTFWESYGYPVGHKLGLTVEGSINAPETPVDGRVGPPETAIQLTCEHGGLGYLNGLSGGAVVHNNTVVGIIRSGPVEFKHKIIHAVSIERITEVLAPMREIVNKNSSDAIKIVSPNILNNAGFDTAILSGDERRSSKTRTNLCRQRILAHGRDHDVDTVKNRILAHKARIISLIGADGIGKKTLALSTANEFLNNFDGVYVADLYPVKSERALIEVGNALGVKEGADNQMTANLIVEIAQQSFLIVIFSADRLVNFRSSIEHLLKHCDNLHIIAVTEKKLGWAGEQEYAVPLLSMDELRANDSAANLAVLPPIRLFLERARLTKPEFEITDINAMYIVQLCKLTGGSPFGINIVAALSNQMLSKDSFDLLKLAELVKKLQEIETQPIKEKHREMITLAVAAIDQDTQSFLCRIAVFENGCPLDAALEIDKTPLGSPSSTRKKLYVLTQHNLLFSYVRNGQYKRFSMPADVRRYCYDRLEKSGEIYSALRDHAEFYCRMVNSAERRITLLGGAEISKSIEALEIEYGNILAAVQWAKSHPDGKERQEMRLSTVGNLFWFWNMRGSLHEGRKLVEELLEHAWPETEALGAALYCAGGLSFLQGDFTNARSLLTRSITVFEKIGNERRLAFALVILGMVALHANQADEALWHERRAVHLFEQIDNSVGRALALNDLANVLLERQNVSEAEELYVTSYKLWKDLHNQWGMGLTTSNLGNLNWRIGKYEAAERWLIESMAMQQSGRYQWGYAESTKRMGYVALAKSNYCSAAGLFYDSMVLHHRIGRIQLVADCIDGLAEVALKVGRASESAVLLGAAEAIRKEIGTTLPVVPRKMHDDVRQAAMQISEREHGNPEVFSVYLNQGMRLGLLKSVARAGEFAQQVISSGASG